MLKNLVEKSRSYRRFFGDKKLTLEQLKSLVDLARLSPSGGNRQSLKYYLVCSDEMNEKVYPTLKWAGYLKDWEGPIPSERPTGYIVMLRDKEINPNMTIDEGICAQSIFLGATEIGLGGCYIASFNKPELSKILELEERYEIALVIALGYPKEEVVIEPLVGNGDVKYYRDEKAVHHVPKRLLDDLIINKK